MKTIKSIKSIAITTSAIKATIKNSTKLAYDDFCSGCGRPHEDCNC